MLEADASGDLGQRRDRRGHRRENVERGSVGGVPPSAGLDRPDWPPQRSSQMAPKIARLRCAGFTGESDSLPESTTSHALQAALTNGLQ